MEKMVTHDMVPYKSHVIRPTPMIPYHTQFLVGLLKLLSILESNSAGTARLSQQCPTPVPFHMMMNIT